jgi:hypothetical protein
MRRMKLPANHSRNILHLHLYLLYFCVLLSALADISPRAYVKKASRVLLKKDNCRAPPVPKGKSGRRLFINEWFPRGRSAFFEGRARANELASWRD